MNRLDDIKARVEAAEADGTPVVHGYLVTEADIDLLTHARTDLPALLAVAEAARAVVESATTTVQQHIDGWRVFDRQTTDERWEALRAALAPLLEDVG